jgi:hypothetical protein
MVRLVVAAQQSPAMLAQLLDRPLTDCLPLDWLKVHLAPAKALPPG